GFRESGSSPSAAAGICRSCFCKREGSATGARNCARDAAEKGFETQRSGDARGHENLRLGKARKQGREVSSAFRCYYDRAKSGDYRERNDCDRVRRDERHSSRRGGVANGANHGESRGIFVRRWRGWNSPAVAAQRKAGAGARDYLRGGNGRSIAERCWRGFWGFGGFGLGKGWVLGRVLRGVGGAVGWSFGGLLC